MPRAEDNSASGTRVEPRRAADDTVFLASAVIFQSSILNNANCPLNWWEFILPQRLDSM